jgi:hypothetical protein
VSGRCGGDDGQEGVGSRGEDHRDLIRMKMLGARQEVMERQGEVLMEGLAQLAEE